MTSPTPTTTSTTTTLPTTTTGSSSYDFYKKAKEEKWNRLLSFFEAGKLYKVKALGLSLIKLEPHKKEQEKRSDGRPLELEFVRIPSNEIVMCVEATKENHNIISYGSIILFTRELSFVTFGNDSDVAKHPEEYFERI